METNKIWKTQKTKENKVQKHENYNQSTPEFIKKQHKQKLNLQERK